jgi:hypothetical protein
MSNPRAHPNSDDHEPQIPTAGMPRWVKAFVITVAALVLLLVAVMLITGGDHGPGRHLSSAPGGAARQQGHVLSALPGGPGCW